MRLTHLTPALDTCRALRHAGFPQNTVFVWSSWGYAPRVSLRTAEAGPDRSEVSGAPTLSEVLTQLPAHLNFSLPHPIYGTMERTHALEISVGSRTVIGYGRVGVHEMQYRMEHEKAVEVAARLYLALHGAGRLDVASHESLRAASVSDEVEHLAHAA